MKRILVLLLLLQPFLPLPALSQTNYILVWRDDFSGSALDRHEWRYSDCWNQFHPSNQPVYYPQEYDLHGEIEVGSGTLILTATDESWTDGCYSQNQSATFPYTGGKVASTRFFKYGSHTIVYRIQHSPGLWPAYWLIGGGEEIDIFEIRGNHTDEITYNYHDYPTGTDLAGPGDPLQTFTLHNRDWNETSSFAELRFSRYQSAGQNYFEWVEPFYNLSQSIYSLTLDAPAIFTNAQNIIINNGLDPNHENGNVPSDFTDKIMEVDYVQFAAQIDCEAVVNKAAFDVELDGSYLTGKELYLAGGGSSFVVEQGGQDYSIPPFDNDGYFRPDVLEALATDMVVLKPGFHAEHGSKFDAKIVTCDYYGYEDGLYQKIQWSSIQGAGEQQQISLYPNPSDGSCTLSGVRSGTAYVSDLMGHRIGAISVKSETGETNIDLRGYPSGIYIIEVVQNGTTHKIKLVKQ